MTEPSDFERPDSERPGERSHEMLADDVLADEMRADELASAFVDGELTDEEAAQVRSNPDLMARVAEFEAVSALTSSPTSPAPPAAKAAHIAAAMAEFETASTSPEVDTGTRSTMELTDGDLTDDGLTDGGLADRRRQRAERGNRMLLTLAAAFVVIGGIGLASWGLGSSSDDDAAIAVGDFDAAERSDASPSNAAGASEALEAEAVPEEAMEDESTEEAASDDAAMSDSADFDSASDDSASDDSASDDSALTTTTVPAAGDEAEGDVDTEVAEAEEAFGTLRLASPPADLTIDDLFAQSGTVEPLPIDESLCAAQLGITDGVWFLVENADGSAAEFIVEITDDGREIGRLVDQSCATVLE